MPGITVARSPGRFSCSLFMSPKLKLEEDIASPLTEVEDFQYYTTIEQSDLALTLAPFRCAQEQPAL